MFSQPPKEREDAWLFDNARELIRLLPPSTPGIGFTGGEPTIYGYNHQLCLIDRHLWPFAVRSISDWKNEYHPECSSCGVAERCGGFFFSAEYRHSDHITAIPSDALTKRDVLNV